MQYRRSSGHSTPIAASCSGNDCRCLRRPGIIRPAQSRPMILLRHYLLNKCFLYVSRADLVGTCLAGFAPCVLQLQDRRFGHFLFRQPRRLLQCPEQCLAGCIHKLEALLTWPALLKGTRQAAPSPSSRANHFSATLHRRYRDQYHLAYNQHWNFDTRIAHLWLVGTAPGQHRNLAYQQQPR